MADTYTLADLMEEQRTLSGRPALPDVRPPEMRRAQIGQESRDALHGALSSFGQPSLDALREGYAGRQTPQEIARTFLETGPIGPFAMASSLRRSPDLPDVWRNAHPRTTVDARTVGERPARAATAYGDDVFVSPSIHGMELEDARARLGRSRVDQLRSENRVDDGWVTSTGRFLDRQEANALADRTIGRSHHTDQYGLESTDLLDRIQAAYLRAKVSGNSDAMEALAQQYRALSSRIEYSTPDANASTKGGGSGPPRVPNPSSSSAERPVQAAIRVGGKIFRGPTHFDAMQAAVPRAVEQDLWGDALGRAFRLEHGGTPEMDGFVTSTGRFVTREEATELARAADGYRPSWLGRLFGGGMDAVEYGRHLGQGRQGLRVPDDTTKGAVAERPISGRLSPEIIEILRKYGIIAPPVGAAAASTLGGEPQP